MNGIPLLDSIPVNWFILGVSVLAGVILFLILTQIPDDDDQDSKDKTPDTSEPVVMTDEEMGEPEEEKGKPKAKKATKKKSSKK